MYFILHLTSYALGFFYETDNLTSSDAINYAILTLFTVFEISKLYITLFWLVPTAYDIKRIK